MPMIAPRPQEVSLDDPRASAEQETGRRDFGGNAVNLPALVTAPPSRRWVAAAFIALAILWTIAAVWGAVTAVTGRQLNAAVTVSWLSAAASPLSLIAIAYLLWRRSPTRERERLARATGELRAEGRALEDLIDRLTLRADGHRAAIAEHADQLSEIGNATGARLVAVGETLREGTAMLSRHADRLDMAAESARTDIGVLIEDLPRAGEQVEKLAMAIGAAGEVAMGRIEALRAGLGDVRKVAGAADELASGAVAALAAQVERIDDRTVAAASRLDGAAARLGERVDAACSGAETGMETLRHGVSAQGDALAALVEQTRAALDLIGREASSALAARIAAVAAEIEALGDRLAVQDEAARTLFVDLTRQLAEIETRQVSLTEAGVARGRALGSSLGDVSARIEQLSQLIGASDLASGATVSRAAELEARLDRLAEAIGDGMPVLIDAVDARLAGLGGRADAVAPKIAAIAGAADKASERVTATAGDAERTLTGANDALGAMEQQLERLGGRIAVLRGDVVAIGDEASSLADGAAPRLVETLARAHETGRQAADRAREAIGAVIPQAVAKLGEEAASTLDRAVAEAFDSGSAALSAAAARSTAAADAAAATIGERIVALEAMLAATEARLDETRAAAEQSGDGAFSRRLTAMIEALNSTAIDVTKVLSNEVTDNAWAAYLKGDRGVFARRAVRLIDAGEAREIVRHYEGDGEFRAQVDRYVHDFEAMLRDVLAFRQGTPMGVTLLSSDVGKLYVALAQAIERLRT